ncbi:MAG: hypothetical protein WC509_00310 [Candidatus Izemoplasmatales bacterium]
MSNPNVFLCYDSPNAKQCQTVMGYLKETGHSAKCVPADFAVPDKSPQHILQDLVKTFYDPSDVVVCVVGPTTSMKAHVDQELHHALLGKTGIRKGIVLLMMESPDVSLDKIRAGAPKALQAIPERLRKNLPYVELATFSRYRDLPALCQAAWKKAKDPAIAVDPGAAPAGIRKGSYHEQ